ncbi:MAG: hypothetical protein U5K30_09550 [Acidimicrobiales bacterium]|nr:hypothetical protein [Acidimicrobiales bacterium]
MNQAGSTAANRTPRRHWSAVLYTRVNPLLRRVLTSRLHRFASDKVVLLRITGRRSGRQYAITVGYAENEDGSLDVLVSDAANRTWWRNFVDGGPIGVVLRGEERTGRAIAHKAPTPEFKTIADRSLARILPPAWVERFFAVEIPEPGRGLTDEELERLTGFAVGVSIDLD